MKHKHDSSDGWLSAWHVNPSLNKDYDFLDGLRGVAILMVLAAHLLYVNPQGGPATQYMGAMFSAGIYGVTLFFTLSGFLIALPFWKRKLQKSDSVTPPGYAKRRFWKIYPPLALSILLLTPVYVLMAPPDMPGFAYWKTAFQWLVGWPLVAPVSGKLNPVMWSLIVEVHFYALLPLLFFAFKRLAPRASLIIIFLLFLIVPNVWRIWNLKHGLTITLHPDIHVRFPSALDCFALGVTMAGLENMGLTRKAWAKFGDIGTLLLLAFPFGVAWMIRHPVGSPAVQYEISNAVMKVAAGLTLCYVTDPSHPRARLFSMPWLRWCGIISYEWYLFHQPLGVWARELLGPAGGNIFKYALIILAPLALSVFLAALVYRWFSLPILKYGRGKAQPARGSPTQPGPERSAK